jgi:hypothetical protein
VPASALSGETYARFRLSESSFTGPTGDAASGEVEDYRVVVSNNPFQNPMGQYDVNASGAVTPLDALQVINAIARNAPATGAIDLEVNPITTPQYPDVNGDGQVTPRDALAVIQELADQVANSRVGGEMAVGSTSTYISAGGGILASTPTVVGDLLLLDSSQSESEETVATSSPEVISETSSKTSVFDSPESMAIDSIVDELAADDGRSGEGDSEESDSVDLFFAQL